MQIEIDTQNPQFRNALNLVQFTSNSLFLTGKAGTGKSTFLKYICEHTKKKYVVLAPTGIAAINAGGATLHSFFKLPFHPLVPDDPRYAGRKLREFLKYNKDRSFCGYNQRSSLSYPFCELPIMNVFVHRPYQSGYLISVKVDYRPRSFLGLM